MTIRPGDVCDVCQEMAALVTIGSVDYCAKCAPNWVEGVGVDEDADDDEEEVAA